MRTVTSAQLSLLHSTVREEKFRVYIIRKATGASVDVSDRVLSISIDYSDDEPVAVCTVEFNDDYTLYGNSESLNPLITTSSYNSPDALLWPENEIKIWVGLASYGSTVTDWQLVFHGVLGDEITPSGRKDQRRITIRCRDLAKRLQDRFVLGEWIYGSDDGTSVVAVIQSVLNDVFGNSAPTLYVKDNPNFMIYPVKVGNRSVWDIIQDLIKPTGYQVRYWYWPSGATATDSEGNNFTVSADGYYLTVIDPGRNKTTADDSLSISTDSITEENLSIADDTVRNSFTIRYYDRDTGEYMEVHYENAESIATYGRREMVVGQDDVPYIDTFPEAWALCEVLDNDLSEMPATDRISCQLMWHLELWDLLDVSNALLSTGTQQMGIRRITFQMIPNEPFSMEILGVRDRVIGQVKSWLVGWGTASPRQRLSPSLAVGNSWSAATMLSTGDLRTETVLEVVPPKAADVEYYEWRWAVEGEGVWHEEITREPQLRLMNLPPGKRIAWTCRAKLAEER